MSVTMKVAKEIRRNKVNKKMRIVIPVVAGVVVVSAGIGALAASASNAKAVQLSTGNRQIVSAGAYTDNATGPQYCGGYGGMMRSGFAGTSQVGGLLGHT